MKAAEKSWITNLRPGRRKEHTGPAWMVVEEGQCKETSEIHPVLQAGAITVVRIVSLGFNPGSCPLSGVPSAICS